MNLVANPFDSYSPALATASAFFFFSLSLSLKPLSAGGAPRSLRAAAGRALHRRALVARGRRERRRVGLPQRRARRRRPRRRPLRTPNRDGPCGRSLGGGGAPWKGARRRCGFRPCGRSHGGGLCRSSRGGGGFGVARRFVVAALVLAAPAVGRVAGLRHSGVARRGLSRHPRLEPKRPR